MTKRVLYFSKLHNQWRNIDTELCSFWEEQQLCESLTINVFVDTGKGIYIISKDSVRRFNYGRKDDYDVEPPPDLALVLLLMGEA